GELTATATRSLRLPTSRARAISWNAAAANTTDIEQRQSGCDTSHDGDRASDHQRAPAGDPRQRVAAVADRPRHWGRAGEHLPVRPGDELPPARHRGQARRLLRAGVEPGEEEAEAQGVTDGGRVQDADSGSNVVDNSAGSGGGIYNAGTMTVSSC